MSIHAHLTPKQRIDTAEERIDVLEKQIEAERKSSRQLQEIVFSFASRLSEVEQHQGVLRNIMARMSQKIEVLEHDVADNTSQPESSVRHMDKAI